MQLWSKADGFTKEDLKNNLIKRGVSFTEEDIDSLVQKLKFSSNNSSEITQVERYAYGNILHLDSSERHPFLISLA